MIPRFSFPRFSFFSQVQLSQVQLFPGSASQVGVRGAKKVVLVWSMLILLAAGVAAAKHDRDHRNTGGDSAESATKSTAECLRMLSDVAKANNKDPSVGVHAEADKMEEADKQVFLLTIDQHKPSTRSLTLVSAQEREACDDAVRRAQALPSSERRVQLWAEYSRILVGIKERYKGQQGAYQKHDSV